MTIPIPEDEGLGRLFVLLDGEWKPVSYRMALEYMEDGERIYAESLKNTKLSTELST